MNRKSIHKILMILIFVVLMRFFIVIGLNILNVNITKTIIAKQNTITIDKDFDGGLHFLNGIRTEGNNKKTFLIKFNQNDYLTLLLDNLEYRHTVYINNNLVTQNIDMTMPYYDNDYSYKTLELESFIVNDEIEVRIEGLDIDRTSIYIANTNKMKDYVESKIIISTFMSIILFLVTLISLIFYVINNKEKEFILFSVMGIVSIIKIIILGDISVLSSLFSINIDYYIIFDRLTTVINTFLPAVIMVYIFKLNIKAKYVNAFVIICLILGSLFTFYGKWRFLYQSFYIILIAIGVFFVCYSFILDKRFSAQLLIINGVYFSFATYFILVRFFIYESGYLDFFVNNSFLGLSIYIVGFLILVIIEFYKRGKEFMKKEQEYQRVLLLRGLHHDIKLPLSIIKLNNQMIEWYELSNDERQEYINHSLDAVQRLEKLTENINVFLNAGNINYDNEQTDIRTCFDRIQGYYKASCMENGCRLFIEKDDKEFKLKISPMVFERVIQNLLDNAFKFSGNNKDVFLKYRVEDKLYITVTDNGIGMDEDEIGRIFSPFFRGRESVLKEGFGLGLSVVKNIVDMLNGEIKVDSKKNKGTTITLIFT